MCFDSRTCARRAWAGPERPGIASPRPRPSSVSDPRGVPLGAGGGGFLLMICKSPGDATDVRRMLEAEPSNERARFFDFDVSTEEKRENNLRKQFRDIIRLSVLDDDYVPSCQQV